MAVMTLLGVMTLTSIIVISHLSFNPLAASWILKTKECCKLTQSTMEEVIQQVTALNQHILPWQLQKPIQQTHPLIMLIKRLFCVRHLQ